MLNNNSNKIRNVKGSYLLQGKPGGTKGRPSLLHNGINGQKGGANPKGTPTGKAVSPGRIKVDAAVSALKRKKR